MTGDPSPSTRFGNYSASPEENGTSPALLLADCRAAVDRQHRTLTICRFVGSKVQATIGHFLCRTGALHGAESVGHHRIVEQALHLGNDEPTHVKHRVLGRVLI